MVFGGALGLLLLTFTSVLCILWLLIRLLVIYLKWFHTIDVKYSSIGLGDVENLEINHRLFHLRINHINLFSSFSIFIWRLPIISIDDVILKLSPTQQTKPHKNKPKSDWKKKLTLLKYISIRIEHLQIEYDDTKFSVQRISLYPSATPNGKSSDMWINCEYVELTITDQSSPTPLLLKSTWNSIEIQTNLDQSLLVNTTHWLVEIDHQFVNYYKEKQSNSKSLSPLQPTQTKNLFSSFDQWLEYLHDPLLNVSVRHFRLQYTTIDHIQHQHTLDTAYLSFHNSSQTSEEIRRAYIADFRLNSHSNLLIRGLCQITVYPVRVDVACQLNELDLQLHEQTIQQVLTLLSSRSHSSPSNISWQCDRQIEISFQLLNPAIRLKMLEIKEWFIWQMTSLKLIFHCNEHLETKSSIELQNMLVHTSDNSHHLLSETFINELTQNHFWHCLCFVPTANVTILNSKSTHIQAEIIGIRLQSNQTFISFFKRFQALTSPSSSMNVRSSSTRIIELSLHMKSTTVVICDSVPVYLCLSISTIRAGRTLLEMKKLVTVLQNQPSQNISLISLTQGQKILDIRRLNIQYLSATSTIKISIPHDITLVWSTKVHFFLHRCMAALKFTTRNSRTPPIAPEKEGTGKNIELEIDANAHVYLQLSEECRIHFDLRQFSFRLHRQRPLNNTMEMEMKCPQLLVDFQQQCIFVIHDVLFRRLSHSESLTTERMLSQKGIGTLDMLQNRASLVQINSFSIRFPFDSTFNEVMEKLINIRKWLKHLSKNDGDGSSGFLNEIPQHLISNEVWTDVSIKINDFELTIIDDLFEVKLFQNYCLMADEYHEQVLREEELQRRIKERERASMPLSNINELKRALTEASSQVYIKRCQKTNFDEHKQRIRRNLIRWHLKQVDLTILADQSWTGKENILNIIHRIDVDSPPIPIDTTDLCTMWCRYVIMKCDEWSVSLRDFKQPLWQMQQFHLWGHICGAEVTPMTLESIRTPWVEIGEPYSPSRVQVQRLLSPLKFYHDINSDIDSFLISFGPAWENTMAQVNLCLNGITPRASDPSALLSWWDKIRLFLHGRWSFATNKMSWLYHVGSSPYNDTEEMEWVWDQAYVDWTNGRFLIRAESLSIKLRTSSKYDDCCLLYLPNVETRISLNWLCAGNPNDHHSVRLYTRDAVKTWQKQQPHDSYALYRSHHLNATAKFECKEVPVGGVPPTCTIYASTLRFCERVKNTMMSITRPTRRGRLFLPIGETVVPPRKSLLSRHYEAVELQLILPQFRVKYLTSFARQTGAQVDCQLFNFVTYQELNLIHHHDGLSRRARTLWKPKMMNVNLKRAQMWLLRDANEDKEINENNNIPEDQQESQQQRTFFLSLDSLIYVRSSSISNKQSTHSVLIDELKAVWNLTNRRTLFLVYERYRRNNILRSNLSNPFAKEIEYLQQEKNLVTTADQSPSEDNAFKASILNDDLYPTTTAAAATATTTTITNTTAATTSTTSAITVTANGTTTQPSTLASFLDQLIDESQHKPSVDLDPTVDASVSLVGLRQCTKDDVDEHTLRIELADSQIALRGIESGGYVILSAAIALVDQYRHKPVWRDQQLCDKTSWSGDLQGMQYFATTVSSSSPTKDPSNNLSSILLSSVDDDIIWIPRQDIRDENSLLGESSRSVIGSVATNNGDSDQQLQCIVSKSNAMLSYVFYTEQTQQEEEPDTNIVIPPFTKPSLNESNPIGENDRLLVDSFTFIHHDIQLSTNSSQYRTIKDIVNNLLLYVEPKQEGANAKLRKLRLQIQLANNLPVLRESIRHLLERVRATSAELRRLEREIYYFSRADTNLLYAYSSDEEDVGSGGSPRQRTLSFTSGEYVQLQTSYSSVKIELNKLAEKLGMMCAVYKDMQLARLVKLRIAATSNKIARLEQRYELHGGSITWFIKHEDGQITNAQFLLRNILYTKRYFENGTNEHAVSISQAQVDNLLPDDRYRTILTSNCQQQHTMIRVYCKEGESVGGIAVKEHLEINVAPLVIQMTRRFSQMLMAFLFPNKTQQTNEMTQGNNHRSNKTSTKTSTSNTFKRRTRSAETMLRRVSHRLSNDIRWGEEELLTGRSLFYFSYRDLDAMEKRAKNTLTFQYIKIPEVSLIVSYKIRGTKQKKIGDLENARISFPTLEYRNLTCSWHDLVLAIKSDVKTVLLSQAIRQNINSRLPFIGKAARAHNQPLLATTTTSVDNSPLFNADAMNSSNNATTELSSINEQEEEERQKHKMKLVLGTKISKDLISPFKRRKEP